MAIARLMLGLALAGALFGGVPASITASSRPHAARHATPGGWMQCVESLSLGQVD